MEAPSSPASASARRKVQPVVLLIAMVLVLAFIWRTGRQIFDAGRARVSGQPPAATRTTP